MSWRHKCRTYVKSVRRQLPTEPPPSAHLPTSDQRHHGQQFSCRPADLLWSLASLSVWRCGIPAVLRRPCQKYLQLLSLRIIRPHPHPSSRQLASGTNWLYPASLEMQSLIYYQSILWCLLRVANFMCSIFESVNYMFTVDWEIFHQSCVLAGNSLFKVWFVGKHVGVQV